MKRIILAVFLLFAVTAIRAQDYLQIVALESDQGMTAVFTSAAQAANKKDLASDGIKSMLYTLFFNGVDGVNDGKPIVGSPNPAYTNSFFNAQARYVPYIVKVEEASKPVKAGANLQATMRITVRLKQLVNDVKKNTNYASATAPVKTHTPKPTIIVVPYARTGENFESIIENKSEYRIAVATVQRGFEESGIKTIDLQARILAMKRRAQYEENAGVAESNDKQLLLSSGADVYVTVDLVQRVSGTETSVVLAMKAYETASGTLWGSQEGHMNDFDSQKIEMMCSYAVSDHLPGLMKQIINNYSQPARVVLQIAITESSMATLQDARCSDGTMVADFIQNWLDRNAYQGDYHLQGIMDESMIFDYILIPREDANGYKMNASKFARTLNSELSKQGVPGVVRIEGNTILLTLDLQ